MKVQQILLTFQFLTLLASTRSNSSFSSANIFARAQQPDSLNIPFMDGPDDPQIFGIGNSYTQNNNLYGLVGEVFRNGIPQWADRVNTFGHQRPGETLAGHLEAIETDLGSTISRAVRVGSPPSTINWTYFVLQDQSQIPGFYEFGGEGTQYYDSFTAAIQINEYIRDNVEGAQTMFLMTWGRRDGDSRNPTLYPDFLTMQDYLTEGYMRYRDATSTIDRPTYIAPAGLVFETIYMDLLDEGIEPTTSGTLFHGLYQNDGSHPAISGSYVAALTIYTAMTGRNPRLISWVPDGIDAETGSLLQDAVGRTIQATFEEGIIEYPWTSLEWSEEEEGEDETVTPTDSPTNSPSAQPTDPLSPSNIPTGNPTSSEPSSSPSAAPSTNSPSLLPSGSPTILPQTTIPTPDPTTIITTTTPSSSPTTQILSDNSDESESSTSPDSSTFDPTMDGSNGTYFPTDTMIPSLFDSIDVTATEAPSLGIDVDGIDIETSTNAADSSKTAFETEQEGEEKSSAANEERSNTSSAATNTSIAILAWVPLLLLLELILLHYSV